MKNKKFYTNRKLPEPGTPVDEAWKQMHGLLVKNNFTVPEKKNRRRMILLVLLLLFISVTGIILYSVYFHDQAVKIVTGDSSNNKTQKQNNTNNNSSADTVHQLIQQDTLGDNKAGHSTNVISNNNFRLPVTHDHTSISKNIPGENKLNPVNQALNHDYLTEAKKDNKVNIENETSAISATVQNKKEDTVQMINDSIKNTQQAFSKNKPGKNSKQVKFYYGLQWNINFSLKSNRNYFDAYDGGKQYYMWALPAAWAKMDINKKHGIRFRFNPFSQEFAGKQVVNVCKAIYREYRT
jgi:hypothetical protein